MDKIKLRDVLLVVDDLNVALFGVLNDEKTELTILRTGDKFPVLGQIQEFCWQRPFVDLYETFCGYEIAGANSKIKACPLMYNLGELDGSARYADYECVQVSQVCSFFFDRGETTKYIEMAHVLEAVLGCGEMKGFNRFRNNNRNKPISIDLALKIENAINKAGRDAINKRADNQTETSEECVKTEASEECVK